MSNDRKPLGRVQLQPRVVRPDAAPQAVEPPASRPERLGPPVPRADPPRAMSFTDLPATAGPAAFDLGRLRVELAALKLVPRVVALAHKLLPLRETATELEVVMVNPDQRKAIDELEFVTGKTVRAFVAPEAELVAHLRNAYDAMERGESVYAPAPKPAEPAAPPAAPAARVQPPVVEPAPELPVHPPAPRVDPKMVPRERRATPPPQPAQRGRSRTPAPRRASSSSTRAEKPAAPTPRRTPPPRRAIRDSRSDDD